MKQLKRLTSILLVLGMVLGLMPLSAFAAESAKKPLTDEVDGNTYTYMPLNDSTVELTKFSTTAAAADAVIHSPVTLNGKDYSVVSIGSRAFFKCAALKSVQFKAPIESIGDGAFEHCENLTTVILPDSIDSIEAGAFAYCFQLKTVNLGNSVRSIGESAFVYCTSLESVTLPDSIDLIENDAFAYCTGLESVTIPSSVRTIGKNAFSFGDQSEKETLEKLHYTGTKEQWDELAEKNDFTNNNPLLTNPQNFYCAHTVSFDYGSQANGTGQVVQEVVKYGETVNKPADPKADDYRFEGWYTQKTTVLSLILARRLRKM